MKKNNPPKFKNKNLYIWDNPPLIKVNDPETEIIYKYVNSFYYLAYTLRGKSSINYLAKIIGINLDALIVLAQNNLLNKVDESMVYNTLLLAKTYLKKYQTLSSEITSKLETLTNLEIKSENFYRKS